MRRNLWGSGGFGVGLLLLVLLVLPLLARADAPAILSAKARLWAERELPIADGPVAVESESAPDETDAAADDWARLAFQSYRDGNWEIYLAWSDGSHATRLTNHSAADVRPRLNRGATKVLFESNRDGNWEIYSMTTSGAEVTRLTNHSADDGFAAWSPDGKRIAFASDRDGNYEIYVMNADGSDVKRLTNHSADDAMPDWSPDGSKIAWIRFVPNSLDSAIWVMNADGSNPHALTSAWRFLQHPVWSPDGTQIACDFDAHWNDGFTEPAVVNADGTNLHSLHATGHYYNDHWMGGWAPGGDYVIYSQITYVSINGQLYIYQATIQRSYIGSSWEQEVIGGPYNMFPHLQSMDVSPPVVAINMPRYLRSGAASFPVCWSATDDLSGVRSCDVEYWTSGAWHSWLSATRESCEWFRGAMGQTYVYRVRARDNSGNLSEWATSNPVTPYAWMITGTVRDARDAPVPNATLVGDPPLFTGRTDAEGQYLALSGVEAPYHTVTVTHVGYVPSPGTTFGDGYTSVVEGFNPYLSAVGNRITNGDFQTSDLTGWEVVSGTVTNTPLGSYTGGLGAILGAPRNLNLGTHSLSYQAEQSGRAAHLALNSEGVLHTLYTGHYLAGTDYRAGLFFENRLATGQWTAPEQIAGDTYGHASMAVDPADNIHVVWVYSSGTASSLLYRYKTPGREWSQPVTIPGSRASLGAMPHLVADSQRTLHLVWDCSDCRNFQGDVYYTSKPWAKGWTQPITLPVQPMPGWYRDMDLVVGQEDRLHLSWMEGSGDAGDPSRLKYSRKVAGGTWTTPVLVAASFGEYMVAGGPILVAAPENRVYLFWAVYRAAAPAESQYRVYCRRSDNGGQTWGTPMQITTWGSTWAGHMPEVQADAQGRLHAIWAITGNYPNVGLWYSMSSDLGLTWTQPVAIGRDSYRYTLVLDEARDRLYVGAIGWVGEMPLREPTGDDTLRQRVSIPANAHEPTLSFVYRLTTTFDTGEDRLEVLAGETTVFTATARGDNWTHVWVDMDAWKGTEVDITFRMHNESGGAWSWASLDDISLAPWVTPLVRGVLPPRVPPGSAAAITIRGENFLATPTVRVGTSQATAVQWVDDGTLLVTLPATLPPGRYDVWVKNPGGQEGVAVGAVNVGGGCYLPVVLKSGNP